MPSQLSEALQRAVAVLERRPDMGVHDDAPASAQWQGGTRVATHHANGTQVASDMPCELGGTGDRITPGWLFRAGIASCSATSIAMAAASQGVDLSVLEVQVTSRSDTRGLLGMEENGKPVFAGPRDFQLAVKIAAPGVADGQLHALVEAGLRCSPMPNALQTALPMDLRVEIAKS